MSQPCYSKNSNLQNQLHNSESNQLGKSNFAFLKALLLVLCLTSYAARLQAQKNMEDVIYLKNGSKINGIIMQLIPDSTVRIKQTDGSVWVFPMKEVDMIDKEIKNKYKANIADAKGYRFGIDAGIRLVSGPDSNSFILPGFHCLPMSAIILTAIIMHPFSFFRAADHSHWDRVK